MVKVVGFNEAQKKKVTCKSCAAILEYTQAEVRVRRGTDYGGGPDGCEWVVCPNCGEDATIRSW